MNHPFFTKIDPFVMQGLSQVSKILDRIMPMNAAQKRDLPYACKDLSEELTSDRDALSRPYWSSPRLMSAYMHYFLPWNLIRLSRLFPALNLGKNPAEPLILDLGSGPLTLPIALWLSRKDLRQKPVTIVCSDIAPQPLNLGRILFDELRKELDPQSEWKIHTMRTPLFKALKQVRGNPWLITMGNILNEGEEKKSHPIQKQINQIITDAKNILREDGKIFAVEPGTRQGARVLSILRESATQLKAEIDDDYDDYNDDDYKDDYKDDPNFQDNNNDKHSDYDKASDNDEYEDYDDGILEEAPFIALSPCTHNEDCPLSGHSRQGIKFNSAWCHFNSPADYVPTSLRQLSQRAGMDKDSISLSFLYLAMRNEGERIIRAERNHIGYLEDKARVISEAFPVPYFRGRARYACHETGLLLLVDSAPLPTASLCDVIIPKPIARDIKSKAAFAIPVPTDTSVSHFLEDYQGQADFYRDTSYRNFENKQHNERDHGDRNNGDRNRRAQQNEYPKKKQKSRQTKTKKNQY